MAKLADFFILFTLCVSGGWPAAAQEAPPAAPTFRSGVQEVVLDVVVRDGRGRPVKNLKESDLEVYEDGARQQLRSFRLLTGRTNVQTQSGKQEGKASVSGPATANPLRAVNLVCIVFHNLDPYTKKFAIDAAQEFLKSHFDPDTWIGVFNLDEHLNVLTPFTTNRNEVLEAASRAFTGHTTDFASSANAVLSASPNVATIEVAVAGNPAKGGSVLATQKISGGELNPLANNGADVATDAAANAQRGDLAGQRRQFLGIEGMRQTDQINAMIAQLQTLPGRKSILLLSPGLTTTGDPDRFKAMVDKANRADMTFYALDVNGLNINSNGLASGEGMSHAAGLSAGQAGTVAPRSASGVTINANTGSSSAASKMDRMRQSDYIHDAVRTSDTQASLRALSEGTGGFLIANTNDFRKSFQRLIEDVDTHYEVTYRPTSTKYDGRLRSIEVKTGRADLTVQSRTGYFAMPALGGGGEPTQIELAGLAALNVKTPPHSLTVRAAAYQFRPAAGSSQSVLAFELPATTLTATAEPESKRHRMHAAVMALVKDASGQVVNKFSMDAPYEIADENLAAVEKSSFVLAGPVSLPAGPYMVEAAAMDEEGHKAGTSRIGLQSPGANGLGLSSIVLVQRLEAVKGKVDAADPMQFQAQPEQGARVIPELDTRLAAGAHPNVYFVVYPDAGNAEKPKLQVELLVGGKVLAKQAADLPAADATGAVPMVISAPAVAGDCDLRITARQGGSQITQGLHYSIGAI